MLHREWMMRLFQVARTLFQIKFLEKHGWASTI